MKLEFFSKLIILLILCTAFSKPFYGMNNGSPGEKEYTHYSPIHSSSKECEDRPESDENKVTRYFNKYVIENIESSETLLRKAITVILCACGGTAGIPYVEAVCKASGSRPVLCGILGAGMVVAYGCTATWGILKFAAHLNPATEEERYFQSKSNAGSHLRRFLPYILGVFSNFPNIYLVYKYSGEKWIIPTLVINFALKSLGYRQLFEGISVIKKIFSSDTTQSLTEGQELARIMRHNIIPSCLKDVPRKELRELKEDMIEKVYSLLRKDLILQSSIEEEIRFSPQVAFFKKIIQTFSVVMSLGNAVAAYILTYEGVGGIYNAPAFCIPMATIIVAPIFSFDTFLILLSVGKFFDSMYNKVCKRQDVGYLEAFCPKIARGIPVVAVTIATISALGDGFIVHDIVSHSPLASLKIVLPCMVFVSSTLLASFSISDIARQFSEYIYSNVGGEVPRKIFKWQKELGKIANFLEGIPEKKQAVEERPDHPGEGIPVNSFLNGLEVDSG